MTPRVLQDQVFSRQEARIVSRSAFLSLHSTLRFMELHKEHLPGWEGENEIRQVFGPEDFAPPGIGVPGRRSLQNVVTADLLQIEAGERSACESCI
ncbi:MAG: hypothetical protein ACR2JB_03640 [Bryobacteraceae bacterium]